MASAIASSRRRSAWRPTPTARAARCSSRICAVRRIGFGRRIVRRPIFPIRESPRSGAPIPERDSVRTRPILGFPIVPEAAWSRAIRKRAARSGSGPSFRLHAAGSFALPRWPQPQRTGSRLASCPTVHGRRRRAGPVSSLGSGRSRGDSRSICARMPWPWKTSRRARALAGGCAASGAQSRPMGSRDTSGPATSSAPVPALHGGGAFLRPAARPPGRRPAGPRRARLLLHP